MSITGSLTIHLDEIPELFQQQRTDRAALQILDRVPDGAAVTVDIGSRRYVSEDAAIWINRHVDRLHVRIDGTDPDAVHDFVTAARSGQWSVLS